MPLDKNLNGASENEPAAMKERRANNALQARIDEFIKRSPPKPGTTPTRYASQLHGEIRRALKKDPNLKDLEHYYPDDTQKEADVSHRLLGALVYLVTKHEGDNLAVDSNAKKQASFGEALLRNNSDNFGAVVKVNAGKSKAGTEIDPSEKLSDHTREELGRIYDQNIGTPGSNSGRPPSGSPKSFVTGNGDTTQADSGNKTARMASVRAPEPDSNDQPAQQSFGQAIMEKAKSAWGAVSKMASQAGSWLSRKKEVAAQPPVSVHPLSIPPPVPKSTLVTGSFSVPPPPPETVADDSTDKPTAVEKKPKEKKQRQEPLEPSYSAPTSDTAAAAGILALAGVALVAGAGYLANKNFNDHSQQGPTVTMTTPASSASVSASASNFAPAPSASESASTVKSAAPFATAEAPAPAPTVVAPVHAPAKTPTPDAVKNTAPEVVTAVASASFSLGSSESSNVYEGKAGVYVGSTDGTPVVHANIKQVESAKLLLKIFNSTTADKTVLDAETVKLIYANSSFLQKLSEQTSWDQSTMDTLVKSYGVNASKITGAHGVLNALLALDRINSLSGGNIAKSADANTLADDNISIILKTGDRVDDATLRSAKVLPPAVKVKGAATGAGSGATGSAPKVSPAPSGSGTVSPSGTMIDGGSLLKNDHLQKSPAGPFVAPKPQFAQVVPGKVAPSSNLSANVRTKFLDAQRARDAEKALAARSTPQIAATNASAKDVAEVMSAVAQAEAEVRSAASEQAKVAAQLKAWTTDLQASFERDKEMEEVDSAWDTIAADHDKAAEKKRATRAELDGKMAKLFEKTKQIEAERAAAKIDA